MHAKHISSYNTVFLQAEEKNGAQRGKTIPESQEGYHVET